MSRPPAAFAAPAARLARLAFFLCLLGLVCTAWAAVPTGAMASDAGGDGLRVESILPVGQVPRLTQVAVRFSRDMRPLGQMDQSAQGAAFSLEPRPAGSYRWLDTRTLAYILDRPLTGATRLMLTVPKGVKSLDGAALDHQVRTEISTPPIKVTRINPEPNSVLGPLPQLTMYINQQVDVKDLAARAYFSVGGRRFALKVQEEEVPAWVHEEVGRAYRVKPVDKLPGGQKTALVIEAGLPPAAGNLPLQKSIGIPYRTFGALRLAKWQMEAALGGGRDPSSALTLEFTNPISAKEALAKLTITPPVKLDPERFGDYASRWLTLDPGFKPRTAYTVTLAAGLNDAWGGSLAQPVTISFRTGDLRPVLSLEGGKGVLEADGPALYPLSLRNIPAYTVGLKPIAPDLAVAAIRAEADRPWDQRPPALKHGQHGAVVREVHPDLAPNRLSPRALDLASLLGKSPIGSLVLVDVRATWPNRKNLPQEHVQRALVQYTDLGLSLKVGQTSGAAWVTSLATGQPKAGVALELKGYDNKVLWKGVSDESGLARLPSLEKLKPAEHKGQPWLNPEVYLLARDGADFALLPAQWGDTLFYSVAPGMNTVRPGQEPALVAHALTQLPLYQPGQTVRLVVYLRKPGPHGLVLPGDQEITVQVLDPYGRPVKELSGKPSAFGSLAGELTLGAAARLGRYRVAVKVDDKVADAGGFRVASFRPPEFRVGLKTPAAVLEGQNVQAAIAADYLFGAPVAGGRATIKADQRAAYYQPPALEGYQVGDLPLPGEEPHLTQTLGVSQATLDAAGRGAAALPQAKLAPGQPVTVEVEASVADAAGLVVSARESYLTHPAACYLGLKSAPVAVAGESAPVELAAAWIKGQEPAPLAVTLTAYRQVWETVREKGPGGFWMYRGQARRTQVWQGRAALEGEPVKLAFTPPQAGTYVLVAEAKDPQGRQTRSASYLWASGKGLAGWQRFDDHRLELKLAKSELAPGDTARLLIQSPFAKATALISLERDGVRRLMVKQVEGPAPVVELPISQGDAPNLFVGVLLVRGRVGEPQAGKLDQGKPQVRIGYAEIKVKEPGSGLMVAVAPSTAKTEPGAEISVSVEVTRNGSGVPAEVTLLAVDERVLSAAGEDNYDPRKTFSQPRPLMVLTADGRTQVVGRRNLDQKGSTQAGGGGLGQALRQRFHPAVFWLAQGRTDGEGRLSASFKLPDSLTAYRIVAVAADQAGDMGLGKAQVIATRPLQILSALPRFLVAGDSFMARATVQNLSPEPGKVLVTAQATGVSLAGPDRLELSLAPGQSQAVGFAARADKGGTATVTITARMGEQDDAARFTIPVLPATALTSAAAAGGISLGKGPGAGQGSATVPLKLPAGAAPHRGGLTVTVASSPAAGLNPAMGALIAYPWDCLEQRLSRAAAAALALAKGAEMGLTAQPGYRELVERTLASAADFQTGSGGFAFWPGMDRPDMFLTAYALVAGRIMATDGGPGLPGQVAKEAAGWLEMSLKHRQPPKPGELGRRTAEALAVWALSYGGSKQARPLFEAALGRAKGLTPFGLACLMQAAHRLGVASALAKLEKLLAATAEVTARGLSFGAVAPGGLKAVLGSRLRGNAAVLGALSQARPNYPRLERLASWVGIRLGDAPSLSTQEAVFGLWGLSAYLAAAGPTTPVKVRVGLAGRELVAHTLGPQAPPLTVRVERSLLPENQALDTVIAAQGTGHPLWTAQLSWAPAQASAKAVNAGLSISRFHQALDAEGNPAPRAVPALGQEMECVLTLLVPQTRHHVLVHDPYPAGLEPVDAAKGAPSEGQSARPGPWQWREARKDGLLLYAPRLEPGAYTFRYKLRATAPGGFVLRPARAEEMYAPEVFGATPAGRLEVR